MSELRTIVVVKGIGWLKIIKARKSEYLLDDYLKTININEYHIYKSTDKQREVDIEDVINFKYSGFMFFSKEIYKKGDIEKWLLKIKELDIMIKYLSKPFPSVDYIDKIRVCDE